MTGDEAGGAHPEVTPYRNDRTTDCAEHRYVSIPGNGLGPVRGFRHLEIRPKWRPGRGLGGALHPLEPCLQFGEAMLQCLWVDMGLWRRAGSGADEDHGSKQIHCGPVR